MSALTLTESMITPPPTLQMGGGVPPVLVIDDSTVCRDIVCKGLREQDISVITAADGRGGLQLIETVRPSLILLDNEMPNMNGIEFLRALRADGRFAATPVMMLTGSNLKEHVVEAIQLRIVGYVLKERLVMADLVARVRTVLQRPQTKSTPAASVNSAAHVPVYIAPVRTGTPAVRATTSFTVPNLVGRDATLAAVVDDCAAKTLAGVVKQISAIAESAKASAAELAAVVRQDPILAMRVIQLASSSAYAGSKARIANVDDAVRAVGIVPIRDLATSIGVFNAFQGGRAGMDVLRCWEHALCVASVMGRIVPKNDNIPQGIPHLIGLCHDLTEIILRQQFPKEFAALQDYAAQAAVTPLSLLPQAFGISYAELTLGMLQRTKCPSHAMEAWTEFYRVPSGTPFDQYKGLLARSLAIADAMAVGLTLVSTDRACVSPLPVGDCRSALIPSAALNNSELKSEAITTVGMLVELTVEQEAQFSVPLIAQREKSLLYVRHPSLAPLDPLEAALKNVARVTTLDRAPAAGELKGIDAMIVAAPAPADPLFSAVDKVRLRSAPPIHVLKLASANEPGVLPAPAAGETQMRYPVSLRSLADFVG